MDLSVASDERLLGLAALGNRHALEELMKRWHKPLHSFVMHQGGEEPEDLCQEIWIKVARAAGDFDTAGNFRSWLFRIAINACRDAHRASESRPRTVGMEAAADAPAPMPETDERADRLRECFAKLPPRDREILSLRFYQGFKENEVAGALGIPIGTVKSRAHAAVEKLKSLISEGKGNG